MVATGPIAHASHRRRHFARRRNLPASPFARCTRLLRGPPCGTRHPSPGCPPTQLSTIAAAVAVASVVTPVTAQLSYDVVAFVTDRGASGGYVGGYFGNNAVYVWATCSVPLFDVTWTGNTLVFSSAQQIYSRAIDSASTTCGTPLLSPVPANVDIAHLTTNGTHVYFTVRCAPRGTERHCGGCRRTRSLTPRSPRRTGPAAPSWRCHCLAAPR